jgi:hypothetical protein
VTFEEITLTAGRRTAQACAGQRIVAAQDTTEINFSGPRSRKARPGAGGRRQVAWVFLPRHGGDRCR